MILAIDVGNTNTVVALFEDVASATMIDHWRLATDSRRTADEWMLQLRGLVDSADADLGLISGAVIGSVVPKVTSALRRCFAKTKHWSGDVVVVDWNTSGGLSISLDQPSELGADRIANAVAVQGGALPAIVVDLGTATTFDVIAADGSYMGGVIMPGIDTSLEALFDKAAALRRIDLNVPSPVVGTSTAGAIRSGATHGFGAQIDGLCERIEHELGPCRVVATGGLGSTVAPFSTYIQQGSVEPLLTLQGLHIIYERNSQ